MRTISPGRGNKPPGERPTYQNETEFVGSPLRIVRFSMGESAMDISKKLTAEFIGTFWLVLGGCGAAVLAEKLRKVRAPAEETHAQGRLHNDHEFTPEAAWTNRRMSVCLTKSLRDS